MVTTFGNNIFGAYTDGKQVREIYTYGEKVWPETYSGYYIKWSPADLSGSFTIGGETRWLQDYSGFYSGPFLSSTITVGFSSHPTVMVIDAEAFASTGVIAVDTNLEFVDNGAFLDCSSLYYINMPNVIRTRPRAFMGCTHLLNIELPRLDQVSQAVFTNCSTLLNVSLPECSLIEDFGAFGGCYNLQDVYLPKCEYLYQNALAWTGLSTIELPICSFVGSEAFRSSPSLHTVILGYSGVAYIGEDAFKSTLITATRGSIYVPLSLVSEYKNASGWSYYSAIIQPIPHP